MFVLRGVCPWFASKRVRVAIWTFYWLVDKGVVNLCFFLVGFTDSTKISGGHNSCYFYPNLGENDPIWRVYFFRWVVQPPTSKCRSPTQHSQAQAVISSPKILGTTRGSIEIRVIPQKNVCTIIYHFKVIVIWTCLWKFSTETVHHCTTIIEFYLAFNQGLPCLFSVPPLSTHFSNLFHSSWGTDAGVGTIIGNSGDERKLRIFSIAGHCMLERTAQEMQSYNHVAWINEGRSGFQTFRKARFLLLAGWSRCFGFWGSLRCGYSRSVHLFYFFLGGVKSRV